MEEHQRQQKLSNTSSHLILATTLKRVSFGFILQMGKPRLSFVTEWQRQSLEQDPGPPDSGP